MAKKDEAEVVGVDVPHQCELPDVQATELWTVVKCPVDQWRWRLEPVDASAPIWRRYGGPVGAPTAAEPTG